MKRASLWLSGFLLALLAAAGGAAFVVVRHGVSARDEPTRLEAFLARQMRRLAIPSGLRTRTNPVPPTPDALARARAHFADHCASCHGNDGRGRTALGRNLYPKAPDMTLPPTQGLSDGELYAIIENGVRADGHAGLGPEDDAETWELVHFIRKLPSLTAAELEEMKDLNPKTRREHEEDEEIRRFLSGEDSPR